MHYEGKTIQDAAKLALEVQDACNLSGVLAAFDDIVMNVIWPEARRLTKGTEWVNQHPIVCLFLDKLSDLNGRQDAFKVWDRVEELAKGNPDPVELPGHMSLTLEERNFLP